MTIEICLLSAAPAKREQQAIDEPGDYEMKPLSSPAPIGRQSYFACYLTFPIGNACPLIDMVGYWAFLKIFSARDGTSLST
jgi:hypothetical protein